jgi:hypothetical protein
LYPHADGRNRTNAPTCIRWCRRSSLYQPAGWCGASVLNFLTGAEKRPMWNQSAWKWLYGLLQDLKGLRAAI